MTDPRAVDMLRAAVALAATIAVMCGTLALAGALTP